MRRVAALILLSLAIAQVIRTDSKPVRITGPTVIDKDMDTNDALDDFQWYVRHVG